MTSWLAEHFFRHEYGRLVSMLARRVGVRHLEAVEDAVQAALLAAVESWPKSAENPSAWLYRVAHDHFAGELRRQTRGGELATQQARAALESTNEQRQRCAPR
jgi:predicted RNA polymerase sigma factor